jgi:ABC-type bacteriocin/lantibiotic exporter with double-glycine peptidase domain
MDKVGLKEALGSIDTKILRILNPELSFYIVALIYGAGVSLLSLAIPVSVQGLVNTVNFGILRQPLVVLSVVLLLLLLFSGVLTALQVYIVELYQRKFYTRLSASFATNLLNAPDKSFKEYSRLELSNRYFDIMTIQKSMMTLVMDGISVALQTIVGLIILAFYHPYFIVFDVVMIFLIWMVWYLYGSKAMYTAIKESKAKYDVAGWFLEISREPTFFKGETSSDYAYKRSDEGILDYISKREDHFKNLFTQHVLLLLIYAFLSSLILGLGGYLVLIEQLTLGQLVAAELIIMVILGALSKSGKYLEAFYDLTAAVDKISQVHFLDVDSRVNEFRELKDPDLVFKDVRLECSKGGTTVNKTFHYGKSYIVRFEDLLLKRNFINSLRRKVDILDGMIEIDNISLNSLSAEDIANSISMLYRPIIIKDTIRQNLCLGLKVEETRIRETLRIVGLESFINDQPEGLETPLKSNDSSLSEFEKVQICIARILLQDPKIVILEDLFEVLSKEIRNNVIKYYEGTEVTLILVSNRIYNEESLEEYRLGES